ncbi:MAG: hypothetical protein A2075_00905 [Geobacteraceae bacterium GWC2_58_44]|nr:MAG: hypothetical protein A2075_00905 [Geobacteraceae bacterium GWC2_58_44]HBG07424.1 DUF192 domain-containing protein [Geobacter sp.]
MKALNLNSGRELAGRLSVAATLFSRAKGLLGRQALAQGEGLLIRPCKGVHTFLMKFPIDVVFLDKNDRIVETVENLQPYRMTRVLLGSTSAIELPAGTVSASATVVGNQVVFD